MRVVGRAARAWRAGAASGRVFRLAVTVSLLGWVFPTPARLHAQTPASPYVEADTRFRMRTAQAAVPLMVNSRGDVAFNPWGPFSEGGSTGIRPRGAALVARGAWRVAFPFQEDPRYVETRPLDLNERGDYLAVRWYWQLTAGGSAILERRETVLHLVGFPLVTFPAEEHYPIALNNRGEVLLQSTTPSPELTYRGRAWIRRVDGRLDEVAGLPGDERLLLHDLNDRGDIVGRTWFGFPNPRAFLLLAGSGAAQDIFRGEVARMRINNCRQVLIAAYVDWNGNHHHVWENGTVTDMAPGGEFTDVADLNDRGEAVVRVRSGFQSGAWYLYRQGSLQPLPQWPDVAGDTRTELVGPNNLGQIYGFRSTYVEQDDHRVEGFRLDLRPEALQTHMRAVDPVPAFLQPTGTALRSSAAEAAALTTTRSGIVADGLSRLLIVVPSAHPVQFSIEGRNPADGSLAPLAGGTPDSAITILPEAGVAVAVYRAPDGLGLPPTDGSSSKLVCVRANGACLALTLHQPPAILIHGLWSEPGVWSTGGFDLALRTGGITPIPVRHSGTESWAPSASSPTLDSVEIQVRGEFTNLRASGVAVSRVDVVGHSMGGLIGRALTQRRGYHAPDNFQEGAFRRMITLGTPHHGSPLADVLWNLRDRPIAAGGAPTFGRLLERSQWPLSDAVESLRPGSTAFQRLTRTPVRAHALAARWAPSQSQAHQLLDGWLRVVSGNVGLDDTFGTPEHDLIVSVDSQLGGLSLVGGSLATGTVHSRVGPNAVTETNSPDVQQRVTTLLRGASGVDFADAFPAPTSQPAGVALTSVRQPTPTLASLSVLTFVSPAANTSIPYAPGSTVTLRVTATGAALASSVVFLVDGVGLVSASPAIPLEASFTLPSTTPLGPVNVVAFARDAAGDLAGAHAVFTVSPAGQPTTLRGIADRVTLRVGTSRSLNVLGTFEWAGGSVEKDLNLAALGTTYHTEGSAVQVSPDGVLTGLAVGEQTIEVRNGTLQAIVVVEVVTASVEGDADGDGLDDAWESRFGLDASSAAGVNGGAGDPDGDGRTNAQELEDGTHPRGFFRRYLAEGAANAFFDLQLALLNVGSAATHLQLRYLQPGGTTTTHERTLAPLQRLTLTQADLAALNGSDFSTVLESDQPVILDRTMSWGGGYGSHAETGLPGAATTWYLAEGSTTAFSLFYLLQNANTTSATATVRYIRPGGLPPLERVYTLPPQSRTTIPVNSTDAALSATDVSAVIVGSEPIIVERAMYRTVGSQAFAAGHGSAGITAPSTAWFLAEGATGAYFDLFVLVANPNDTTADVRVDYLLTDGRTFSKSYAVAPNSRFTIWVDDESIPGVTGKPLADVAVSSTVTSTNGVPIIVERTMWWPGPAITPSFWTEAHNSPGATATGTRWALAEGELGGTHGAQTYILIANTSATAGQARVTLYFEDGTSAARVFDLLPNSRRNVDVASDFAQAAGRRFGTIVESLGSSPAEIVVERAMYTSPGGVFWAAGTNALGARLP